MSKWSQIKRHIKKHGCYKLPGGTNHEHWRNPVTGAVKNLSRHDSQEASKKAELDVYKVLSVPPPGKR